MDLGMLPIYITTVALVVALIVYFLRADPEKAHEERMKHLRRIYQQDAFRTNSRR